MIFLIIIGLLVFIAVLSIILIIIPELKEKGVNMNYNYVEFNIQEKLNNKKIIFLIFSIFAIVLFFINVYFVKTGEVVVVSTFGKVAKIQEPGLHMKIPFIQSNEKIEVREKSYIFAKNGELDTSLEVSTRDIQSIKIELALQVKIIDAEKLYTSFGNNYENRLIRPRVKEIVQSTISRYTIEEFITKRSEISRIINQDIYDDLFKYGIETSNVSITNHDFSDDYEAAIEKKKIAEQEVEKAKSEQAKLLLEQENKVKLAELELKRRELEAKANSIESQTLTPQLLKKMAIEKWDGKLPQVQGNNSNTLIDLKEEIK